MKALLIYAVVFCWGTAAAKDFVNLNFDDGGIPSAPFDLFQPAEFVLPGWTARMGDHVQTEILWSNALSESGWVGVNFPPGPGYLQEGRYGVRLQAGAEYPTSGPIVPASISQTGVVPASALSMVFRSNLYVGASTEIRMNGQPLSLYNVSEPASSPVWGWKVAADVSGFSGQEVELTIITYPGARDVNGMDIDSLRFSSDAVPEPSTLALVGLGLAALAWRCHGKCRCSRL